MYILFWPGWASSVQYSSHIPGTSGYHYSEQLFMYIEMDCMCTCTFTCALYTCTKPTLSVLNVFLQLSAENERLKSELESYKEKYRKEKQK